MLDADNGHILCQHFAGQAERTGNEDMGWTLAVDFGTTATAAAVHDGDTELLEIDGLSRLPSLVLLAADGEFVVGTAAGRQAASAPDRVERTPKRRLGDPVVVLGEEAVQPPALVAAVLRHIAAEAIRRQGGTRPDQVVLTHPVSWAGARLAALREAARLADLGDVTLLSEPVAAALHLGDDRIGVGDHVAVYDLGGGTFDAAVLRRTPTGFEPVGIPGGDDQLGGEDFDQLLYEEVGARIAEQDADAWRQLRTSDERAWLRANLALRDEVRAAKEALSSSPEYTIYVGAPADLEVTVTRERLEELLREPLDRTVDELVATVERAGLTMGDLAAIHLVGGSSRIPLVTRLLSERTGLVPTTWGDPKAAVALGAAAKAGAPSPVVLTAPDDPTVVEPVVAADPTVVAPVAAAGAAPAGRKRPVGVIAGAAAVVVALVAFLVLSGGDDEDPVATDGDDRRTTTTEADEPEVTTAPNGDLVVEFASAEADGLSSSRTWNLDPDTDVLTNELAIGNSTGSAVQRTHIEVIPKAVAADVSQVQFSPAYSEVVQADPVVRYDLTIQPGEPTVLAWSVQLPDGVDQAGLEDLSKARDTAESEFLAKLAADLGADPEEFVIGPVDDSGDDGDPGDDGSSQTTTRNDPTTTIQQQATNRAPTITVSNRTNDEREGVNVELVVSDPDGDSVSVSMSGLPTGLSASGSRISGTISHNAASVTTHRNSIQSKVFDVVVTVQDSKGARTSRGFSWTVRDTHRTMPDYIDQFGCGGCGGLPDVAAISAPSFKTACGSTNPDLIYRQSVAANAVIAWGQAVTYWYGDADGVGCDNVSKGW